MACRHRAVFQLVRDLLCTVAMTRALALLPFLVVVMACDESSGGGGSSTGGGSTGDVALDASSGGSAATGDDLGSTSGGGDTTGGETPGAESSTGRGPADDGSSTGDEPVAPDYATPHFPLEVGLQWSYRLTRTDGSVGQDCLDDGATHVMTVTDDAGGVFTRTEEPYCYFSALEFRVDGPYVEVNSGAWYHHLLLPPQQGESWPAGGASGASYVWDEHHETYTVEAGTFTDCWRRKQQGYDVWEIYCRDVGMVESFYDAWGSNSRSELVSFSG